MKSVKLWDALDTELQEKIHYLQTKLEYLSNHLSQRLSEPTRYTFKNKKNQQTVNLLSEQVNLTLESISDIINSTMEEELLEDKVALEKNLSEFNAFINDCIHNLNELLARSEKE